MKLIINPETGYLEWIANRATEIRITDAGGFFASTDVEGALQELGGAGGAGDVVGPAGATTDDIVLFDGATGKLIKDSGVKITDLQPAGAYLTNVSGEDHSTLGNLDYASAGHTGFAPALGADDNYVTDAEKLVIGNTSGTNSGDNAANSNYDIGSDTQAWDVILDTISALANASGALTNDGAGALSWAAGGDISGTGIVGQVAEFVTNTKTIQAANIIAPANLLTLVAGAPYSLTVPATGTVALLATANVFTTNQKINCNSTTAFLVEQDGVKDNVLVVDTTNDKVTASGFIVANSGGFTVAMGGLPGYTATYGGLWGGQVTPSATNYAFLASANETVFNTPATKTLGFRIGNTNVMTIGEDTLVADAMTVYRSLIVTGGGGNNIQTIIRANVSQTVNVIQQRKSDNTVVIYTTNSGSVYVADKIMFTQTDGNEYIDSLADGYLDYGATTAHRFNNNLTIGAGTAATDYTLTFDGETNDGVITWMEDEARFDFSHPIKMGNVKTGATQAAAGAAAGEIWKTASHASLPDNVLLIGV